MYKLSTLRCVDYQGLCCDDSSMQNMLSLLNTAPLWILLSPFWNPHFQTSMPHYGHSCKPNRFSQETPMLYSPLPSQGVTILLYFSQILTIFHTFLVIPTCFWHCTVCSLLCCTGESHPPQWVRDGWRNGEKKECLNKFQDAYSFLK